MITMATVKQTEKTKAATVTYAGKVTVHYTNDGGVTLLYWSKNYSGASPQPDDVEVTCKRCLR